MNFILWTRTLKGETIHSLSINLEDKFRAYWPDEAILDGTWLPPKIEKL
jgi:hypothetical protein